MTARVYYLQNTLRAMNVLKLSRADAIAETLRLTERNERRPKREPSPWLRRAQCSQCNERGHVSSACPRFLHTACEPRCRHCRESGHNVRNCPALAAGLPAREG